MKRRRCKVCYEAKLLDSFYKGSGTYGRRGTCKDCYNRKQRGEPSIVVNKVKKDKVNHLVSNARRKKLNLKQKKYSGRKRKIWNRLNKSIRADKFPRSNTQKCIDCGKQAEQYHHLDYDDWKNVVALCRNCHIIRHYDPEINTPLRNFIIRS